MAHADQDIIRVLFESAFRAKMAANRVEADQEGSRSAQAHGRDRVGRDAPSQGPARRVTGGSDANPMQRRAIMQTKTCAWQGCPAISSTPGSPGWIYYRLLTRLSRDLSAL